MPVATPQWLTDTDEPAPCYCGRPIMQSEPYVLIRTFDGLQRLVHMACAQAFGLFDSDS